ncbi:MAG: hypothetical protein GWO11_01685 [Desulfuromonadales bacterium]|nr:hypothetical protein [Desulfuromonadales bacterium]NIS85516.1 hypothetical protein [Nitrospinaceae bacterium]NIU96720.1 hypothetical protein [Nitrospinaceae bacterium]
MGIEFDFPTDAAPTTSWVPAKQPVFPLEEPVDYPEQLTGETAGGTLYVQDKGVKRERFILQFERLSKTDRDNALTFFNTVKRAFNTFEYKDPEGTLHTVRWVNGFEFRRVVEGRYSGAIELRKEV